MYQLTRGGVSKPMRCKYNATRKYMHAETTGRNPRLADKTIVFSEHEVSKVVVMVTR